VEITRLMEFFIADIDKMPSLTILVLAVCKKFKKLLWIVNSEATNCENTLVYST